MAYIVCTKKTAKDSMKHKSVCRCTLKLTASLLWGCLQIITVQMMEAMMRGVTISHMGCHFWSNSPHNASIIHRTVKTTPKEKENARKKSLKS